MPQLNKLQLKIAMSKSFFLNDNNYICIGICNYTHYVIINNNNNKISNI